MTWKPVLTYRRLYGRRFDEIVNADLNDGVASLVYIAAFAS